MRMGFDGRSLICAAVALVCLACDSLGADARPNVLLICADDHAAYVTGAYGHRVVRTPRIDALASQALLFERAYCNSPVCTASRQSFLTGRYPRSLGVTQLSTPLAESELTMADVLGAAGYDTASIGKMHFNSQLSHGFALRVDAPEHHAWLKQQPSAGDTNGDVLPPWRPFKDPAREWLNSRVLPVDQTAAQMDATYYAARAAEFLQAQRERPFFLMVSFYEPHSPYRFPLEYRGRHRPEEFGALQPGPEDDSQIPEEFRELTAQQKQGIAAAYATSVEFMDHSVGAVLDALERSGHAHDTLVVYMSDHGYLLGQHGRFEKHCSFEEAIRVPLVMRYPGKIAPGTRTSAMVELVDLAPTVYELCGVGLPATVQGRSLASLASGRAAEHREHVIVEYSPNDEAMIRDGRHKFIYERGQRRRTDGYDTGRPLEPGKRRLYDVVADPQELHNLANEPAQTGTVERLAGMLAEHLRRTARPGVPLPGSEDVWQQLDELVQPHDVEKP